MLDFFKPYTFQIAANNIYWLYSYNRFITVLSNTSGTDVQVAIGGGQVKGALPVGLSVELPQGKNFDRILFENTTASAMTITVGLSAGRIYDTRAGALDDILGELQGDTDEENWGNEKTVGAAATSILASNTARKGCNVQNKSTSPGIVYLGFDNTVTTTKWFAELQPGQACMMDDYRGAVYGYGSVAACLVGYGEW